jgi:hypothetical protein
MSQTFVMLPAEELTKINQQLSEIKLLIQKSLPGEQNHLGDWISQEETMKLLGVRETTLYKLRKDGSLIGTQTRPIFYSLKSIHNYLKNRS